MTLSKEKLQKISINLSPKKVSKLKINIGKEGHHFHVYIFNTKSEMEKWCQNIALVLHGEVIKEKFGALTFPWDKYSKDGVLEKDLGFVAFCKPLCYNYVIAHEMTHMTFRWMFRKGQKNTFVYKEENKKESAKSREELIAWWIGETTRQVMTKLKREI